MSTRLASYETCHVHIARTALAWRKTLVLLSPNTDTVTNTSPLLMEEENIWLWRGVCDPTYCEILTTFGMCSLQGKAKTPVSRSRMTSSYIAVTVPTEVCGIWQWSQLFFFMCRLMRWSRTKCLSIAAYRYSTYPYPYPSNGRPDALNITNSPWSWSVWMVMQHLKHYSFCGGDMWKLCLYAKPT